MFKCERCGYITEYKSNLKNHFKRKKPCLPILSDISIASLKSKINQKLIKTKKLTPIDSKLTPIDSKLTPIDSKLTPIDSKLTPIDSKLTHFDEFNQIDSKLTPVRKKIFQCKFCKRTYSKSSNLHRHIRKCSIGMTDKEEVLINFMTNQIRELKEEQTKREMLIEKRHQQEKEEMRKEIGKLLDKVGNITNITNNQQNVYINTYGQENLSYITSTYLNKLLKIPYGAVPQLIKDIHFHPEHPENMNIKITNKKLNYAKVWEGDKWLLKDKRQVIENMVDKGFTIIDAQYKNNTVELENSRRKKFDEFQKKYEDRDKQLLKDLEKNTEMLIINNS